MARSATHAAGACVAALGDARHRHIVHRSTGAIHNEIAHGAACRNGSTEVAQRSQSQSGIARDLNLGRRS
jgi:hypothetical protein